MTIRELFLSCSAAVAELVGGDPVRGAWSEPSALEGYTVAGLAGHLVRGVTTVETYLTRSAGDATAQTDASGYFAAVLGAADPVDSDLHRTVRSRGEDAATAGPAELARTVETAIERLRPTLAAADRDRPLEVLGGLTLTTAEYLRTRLVEVVVHLDDLAVSVGVSVEGVSEDAYREVAAVLAETAARRLGGLVTVRGLARRERHPAAIRAL